MTDTTTTNTNTTTNDNDNAAATALTIGTIVDGYLACWNSTDATVRRAAIEATWTPDAAMTDPLADVTGHAGLDAVFQQFHQMYAGHTFRRAGGIDTHHQFARWGWEMLDTDGNVVLDGIDCAVVAPDGRLTRVVGFFGAALPADAA